MKHTPGKWKPIKSGYYWYVDSGSLTVANDISWEPNARLIAAAPELYAEAYTLAVLCLQSDAYREPDIREAVDNILAIHKYLEGKS